MTVGKSLSVQQRQSFDRAASLYAVECDRVRACSEESHQVPGVLQGWWRAQLKQAERVAKQTAKLADKAAKVSLHAADVVADTTVAAAGADN